MADELSRANEVEAELIRGGGGIFEVKVDGEIVYSKKETGRFPEPGEVARLLES